MLPLSLCPGHGPGCGVVLGVFPPAGLGMAPSWTGTSIGSCLMTGVALCSEDTDDGRDGYSVLWEYALWFGRGCSE